MKETSTLKKLIIFFTGFCFFAYAAYNLFIILRDGSSLPAQGIFLSAVVALMFLVLSAYVLTSGVMTKNMLFRMIRRWSFIIALLTLFLLKLRMVGQVIGYLDVSKTYTVLYAVAYFLVLSAMLILLIYYVFIRRNFLFYPRASVLLPSLSMALIVADFVLEVILFFVFGIGLEASPLRTIVIRPVFCLGFVGLSGYFLFPPKIPASRLETVHETIDEQMIIH